MCFRRRYLHKLRREGGSASGRRSSRETNEQLEQATTEACRDCAYQFERPLDRWASATDLAGALFGVLDVDNSNFIDEVELMGGIEPGAPAPGAADYQSWHDRGGWIDAVQQEILRIHRNEVRERYEGGNQVDGFGDRLVQRIDAAIVKEDQDLPRMKREGLTGSEHFGSELQKLGFTEREVAMYKPSVT